MKTVYDAYTNLIEQAELLLARFPESDDIRETVERLIETRSRLPRYIADEVWEA